MKKLITVLLTFLLALPCGMTAVAAESDRVDQGKDQTDIGVYAKAEYNVEGVYPAAVTDGAAGVTVDENIAVSVTSAPEGAARLVVIPVPKTEKEAWEWITDSLKTTAIPTHTFDIYFEDASGNRLDADGAVVTITCTHCADTPAVCSLHTDGAVRVLTVSAQGKAVSFTTNGSTYYIIAEELPKHDVEIEDKPGGNVEIDKPNPGTGENVTITPTPDEGKVVDRVIVKDEDGNEIPVIDNGDGTYTYGQPDGDVTIEVTFKDQKTPDSPQTGDNSPIWLCWLLLIVLATGIAIIWYEQRKHKAVGHL